MGLEKNSINNIKRPIVIKTKRNNTGLQKETWYWGRDEGDKLKKETLGQ